MSILADFSVVVRIVVVSLVIGFFAGVSCSNTVANHHSDAPTTVTTTAPHAAAPGTPDPH